MAETAVSSISWCPDLRFPPRDGGRNSFGAAFYLHQLFYSLGFWGFFFHLLLTDKTNTWFVGWKYFSGLVSSEFKQHGSDCGKGVGFYRQCVFTGKVSTVAVIKQTNHTHLACTHTRTRNAYNTYQKLKFTVHGAVSYLRLKGAWMWPWDFSEVVNAEALMLLMLQLLMLELY